MRVFDRSKSFELVLLGDEVYEMKVTKVTSFFVFGFVRRGKSRFGNLERCKYFLGEELKE